MVSAVPEIAAFEHCILRGEITITSDMIRANTVNLLDSFERIKYHGLTVKG